MRGLAFVISIFFFVGEAGDLLGLLSIDLFNVVFMLSLEGFLLKLILGS
jgi:hypothetical protein